MNVKSVVLEQANELLSNPAKRAIMNVATPQDRYLANAEWHHVSTLAYGQIVEGVNHVGQFQTEAGDVWAVHDVETTRLAAYVQVIHAVLVQCDKLTDEQIADLGHPSRAAYQLAVGDRLGDHRAWLIYFERVAPPPSGDAVN